MTKKEGLKKKLAEREVIVPEKPRITADEDEIYKRFIRFKNFAIRDAVTKASRIATLKGF